MFDDPLPAQPEGFGQNFPWGSSTRPLNSHATLTRQRHWTAGDRLDIGGEPLVADAFLEPTPAIISSKCGKL
jgi:hypothetical protein